MSEKNLPLELYKANMQLHLELTRLLQEGTHRWLEAALERGSQRLDQNKADMEGLMESANWQSVTMLPAETFWRLHQHQTSVLQGNNRLVIKNQAAFVTGLQQAISSWQKSVSQAMGAGKDTQPMLDAMKQWATTWAQPQIEDDKPAERARKTTKK